MLTLEALNASRDLVAILADKGVSLRPMAGSPLDEAMKATHTWNTGVSCLTEIDGLPLNLYQSNDCQVKEGEYVESAHDAYMEAVSSNLGTVLASHVSYATTVILPAIHELHNYLKGLQNLEDRCGVKSFRVEEVTGSPLFDVPAIMTEVNKYARIDPKSNLPLLLAYQDLNDEALIKLLKIGSQAYDEAIDQFVANEGIETIREVWRVVFGNDHGTYKTFDEFRADRVKGQPRVFATFLLASRLNMGGDDMPEATGVTGLSLSRYTHALMDLLEVCGKSLVINLEQRDAQVRTGRLIDRVDGKVVYVNKPVYQRWLEEDGDVETLLGSVVSGTKSFFLDDLKTNVERYKKAWSLYTANRRTLAAESMLIDIRRGIADYIRRYVFETDDQIVKNNQRNILNNCDLFCSKVFNSDIKDIDILAMRAICLVVFNHTNGLELLRGVNEAMAENPDIDKEDALNLAVLQYVACWFADQVEIA